MSNHLIIGQQDNLVASAVLSVPSVKTTSAYRKDSVSRVGNGIINLTGDSTVEQNATIDVKIQSVTGSNPRASEPVFSGVGSSIMSDLATSGGASPSEYVVRLTDLGTREAYAELNVEGYVLRHKTPGTAGNAFYLIVDEASIVRTASTYSLIGPLEADINNKTGEEWNFGAVVGESNVVHADAPRISIGDDTTVYRHWTAFEDREWKYKFYPKTVRSYGIGEVVRIITGEYVCTLTDGSTTEVYNAVTVRDLLVDIDTNSSIVDVIDIPDSETTIDNEAAYADIAFGTNAKVAYTEGVGSEYATGFINHYASNPAATEIIEAKCYGNTESTNASVGKEMWELAGSISGDLGKLRTGVPYSDSAAGFGFTIPTKLPDGYGELRGDIVANVDYASRDEGDPPPICVDNLVLGDGATDKTISFIYRERPTDDCSCEDTEYDSLASTNACLFLDPEKEEDQIMALDPEYKSRLEELARWKVNMIESNTDLNSGTLTAENLDVESANQVAGIFSEALGQTYDNTDAMVLWDAAWESAKLDFVRYWMNTTEINTVFPYSHDAFAKEWEADGRIEDEHDFRTPTIRNGRVYKPIVLDFCSEDTVAGAAFPHSEPTDVSDWYANASIGQGGLILPTTKNSRLYKAIEVENCFSTNYAKTGNIEPTWPTTDFGKVTEDEDGNCTLSNTSLITWEATEQYWLASTAVVTGAHMQPGNGHKYYAQGDGTTGATIPDFPGNESGQTEVIDGGVTWARSAISEEDPAAKTGNTEPTWPIIDKGEVVETDGGNCLTGDSSITWEATEIYWSANTPVQLGDWYSPADGNRYFATNDGTTGSAEPVPNPYTSFLDGTVYWETIIDDKNSISTIEQDFWQRYESRMDEVLIEAGIDPNFRRASTVTWIEPGSACWQDTGDANWWVPEGTLYKPAFTNTEYVSVKETRDEGTPLKKTREFGFVIKVECTSDLKFGDSITINIDGAALPATYQVGDLLRMAITAESPLYLQGGVDGDNIITWGVASANGNGTYLQDTDAPALYDDGHIQFRINEGGILNEINDSYSFCVENGTFQWRKDEGTWSSDLPIQDTILSNGITATFTDGLCPSFVADDETNFTVIQQNSIENLRDALEPAYRWEGNDISIAMDLTGEIEVVMLAMHTLPETCTIQITDGGSLNDTIDWIEGPIVYVLDTLLVDPIITLSINDAPGAKIGWLWAGSPFDIYPLAESQRRFERFYMNEGINYGQFNAVGQGVNLNWTGFIDKAEVNRLRGIIKTAKKANNSPICIVGNKFEPDQSYLVTAPDEIRWGEFSDFHDPNPDGGLSNQNINLSMEFTPWRF